MQNSSRRSFLKTGAAALAAVPLARASSYARIFGANDRVRVGVVGFSDRFRSALLPAFLQHAKELNFEFAAVSDIWNQRREEGKGHIEKLTGGHIDAVQQRRAVRAQRR